MRDDLPTPGPLASTVVLIAALIIAVAMTGLIEVCMYVAHMIFG